MASPANEIIEKLEVLLQNKNAVRDAIYYMGITDVTNKFSTYGDLIKTISTANIGFSKPSVYNDPEPPEGSNIVYVSPYGNDTNDGRSWDTAVYSLNTALGLGAEYIYVMGGKYEFYEEITLYSQIKIYGGFYEHDPKWETRNPFVYLTEFDAKDQNLGFTNSYSFSTNLDEGPTALIDGIAISNCRGSRSAFRTTTRSCWFRNCVAINCVQDNEDNEYGGGFYCGRLSILENCLALNCKTQNNGGGFYIKGASTVRNCYAIGCESYHDGGGFYFSSTSTMNIDSCVASGCVSQNNGGGFACYDTSRTSIRKSLSIGNRSKLHGGGFYIHTNYSFLENCVCFNCEGGQSVIYSDKCSLICNTVINNIVTDSTGYPIWIIPYSTSNIYGNVCWNNLFVTIKRSFYFESTTSILMDRNFGDGESNYYGDNFVSLVSFPFIEDTVYYWYKPVGYNIVEDFKNGVFGNFRIADESAKIPIVEDVTPTEDFNGNIRGTESIYPGAFEV